MAPVTLPPGFRFHPTDEEMVAYYLKRKINRQTIELEIIPEVDLYKCEPWDLPEKSLLPSKDLEWYFFSPRDRKYPNGTRTNRATRSGYWKATGKDRRVMSRKKEVGTKKTLVYYRGRAPHGSRTDWVMHEYRLDEKECEVPSAGMQDAYALCRVFKKSIPGPKITQQYYGAPSEDHSHWTTNDPSPCEELLDISNVGGVQISDVCTSNHMPIGDNANWMGFYAEEPLASKITSFHCTSIPSKVDVAFESERIQHRLTIPPLEVGDFPAVDFSSNRNTALHSHFLHHDQSNETNVLHDNLSIPSCAPKQTVDPFLLQNCSPDQDVCQLDAGGPSGFINVHHWEEEEEDEEKMKDYSVLLDDCVAGMYIQG